MALKVGPDTDFEEISKGFWRDSRGLEEGFGAQAVGAPGRPGPFVAARTSRTSRTPRTRAPRTQAPRTRALQTRAPWNQVREVREVREVSHCFQVGRGCVRVRTQVTYRHIAMASGVDDQLTSCAQRALFSALWHNNSPFQ